MNRLFFVLLALTAAAVTIGFVGVGAVAADEPANETDVTDVIEDETAADTLANQHEIQLDSTTKITGWEFDRGELHLAIDAERPGRVTIADGAAGLGEPGATRVPMVDQRVFDGETVLVLPVEEFQGGHSVTVSAGGGSVRLSTAMDEATGDDPFQYFGGESGLFSGMLMAILTSLGAAGYVLWREDSGVMKA